MENIKRIFKVTDKNNRQKTLVIFSKLLAEKVLNGKYPLIKQAAMVSITHPIETPTVIYPYKTLNLLRMSFGDVTNMNEEDAPQQRHFYGFKQFVDDNIDAEAFFVQCGAGLSRSAGVAQALADYFEWQVNQKPLDLLSYGYLVNPLVQGLATQALKGE